MNKNDKKTVCIGVGVIVKKNGLVLLGKRKNSYGAETWAFPGGHLEFGEKVEDCAVREVLEETGITIENLKKETFTEDISKEEGRHHITIFVSADYKDGEPKALEPEKCESWGWFKLDALPEPLFPPIKNLIEQGFNIQ